MEGGGTISLIPQSLSSSSISFWEESKVEEAEAAISQQHLLSLSLSKPKQTYINCPKQLHSIEQNARSDTANADYIR